MEGGGGGDGGVIALGGGETVLDSSALMVEAELYALIVKADDIFAGGSA